MAFEYLKVFTGRRFGFDYISPAVCEAEFSSSGSPFISLLPITRATVSGPVMEARGLGFRFSWGTVFGALCYSIYKAVDEMDPFGPYTLIAECITDTFLDLEDPGLYKVIPITPDGLGDPTEPIHTPTGAAAGGIPAPDHWWTFESYPIQDKITPRNNLENQDGDLTGIAYDFIPGVVSNCIRMFKSNDFTLTVPVLSTVFDGAEANLAYPGAGVTIAGWFYLDQSNLPPFTAANIFRYEFDNGAFYMNRDFDTSVYVLTWSDFAVDVHTIIHAPDMSPGWHFYRAWFDPIALKIKLQFDHGTIIDMAAPAQTTAPALAGALIIGGTAGSYITGHIPWDQRFDETGLWFSVLSQADDAFLYNSGAGKTYPL